MQWIRADIFPPADPAVLHLYQQTLTHTSLQRAHMDQIWCVRVSSMFIYCEC